MTLREAKAFISAWCECEDQVEVAIKTGLDRRGVQNRAAHIRRKGIKLDPLPSGRPERNTRDNLQLTDWEQLKRWHSECSEVKEIMKRRESTLQHSQN